MITESVELKLKEISGRIGERHASIAPSQEHEDIVYLLQVVELQRTQIEMLCAPDHVKRLLRDFSNLTPARQALVLELMREMKEGTDGH